MANVLLTIGMIVREVTRILENETTFTANVNREYDDKFAVAGAKIGNVVNARKPVRFSDASGQGLILQDLTETSVPITLTTQYQRSFTVSTSDLALNIDDFSKRFIRPAVISLANQVDNDGLLLYRTVYNTVGTPGTVPVLLSTYLASGQRLSEEAAPLDERMLCINPAMNASIVNALTGLFNPQITISAQYKKGMMTKGTVGFDWYMDQNVHTHVVGPLGGTPVVNGANQTGASLITNGWTSSAANRLKQGDVFTIGSGATGCFAVNPQNHQSTGSLRQFVVTADTSSDGSGNLTIPISPSITASGAFQTVVAVPSNSATINVLGAASTSTPQGLAFHPDAFTFACADLPLPGGVDMADRVSDKQTGLSVRAIRDYDINTDRLPLRLDLLGGWATIYPELAVRVAS